jgi:hypothetical protein
LSFRRELYTISLLTLVILSVCFAGFQCATAQDNAVALKLQAADTAVDQAFSAVLDTERSGANVTDLLSQITAAQSNLAQAKNAYRSGNTNTAATMADSALLLAQQVTVNAQSTKQNATTTNQNSSTTTIEFTIIGIVVFVLVLFLVWRRVKQTYIERLSQAKPEVVEA